MKYGIVLVINLLKSHASSIIIFIYLNIYFFQHEQQDKSIKEPIFKSYLSYLILISNSRLFPNPLPILSANIPSQVIYKRCRRCFVTGNFVLE